MGILKLSVYVNN